MTLNLEVTLQPCKPFPSSQTMRGGESPPVPAQQHQSWGAQGKTPPARRVVGFHDDAQKQTERVFATLASTPGAGHCQQPGEVTEALGTAQRGVAI